MNSILRPLLAVLLLAPQAALAQDVDKEQDRPKTDQSRAAQQAAASEEASKPEAEGDEVTFEQVMADPDNAELNYRFARAQVRKGDLKGAATTLDRMLLVDPNSPRIRLFYAVVLFRLDNPIEAQRELDILSKQSLSEDLMQEVEAFRKIVAKRMKKNRVSGRFGVGFQFDTNRNAAPAEGSRLFLDTPIPLSASSQRRSDTGAVFLTGLEYRRDLGRGTQVFASGSYYHAAQTLLETLNLQAYSLQAGGSLRRGRNLFTPTAVFDHVLLAQSSFLRQGGVDLRYDRKIGKRGDLYLQFRDVHQDFVANTVVPTADERDGVLVDVVAGGSYVLNPKMRAGVGVQRGWKRANKEYNAYDRYGLLLTHAWLTGKGTFLLTNAVLNYDLYRKEDAAISRAMRRDHTWRLAGTFGAPLSLVHKSLKDLVWTATYEYYHARSTLSNFAYSNNKLSTMLTYKFDLGF